MRSISPRGRTSLNADLIRAPRPCIELVVHEQCHLEQLYHDAAFYHLLAQAVPDCAERNRLVLVPE